jgi:hypothetical protein
MRYRAEVKNYSGEIKTTGWYDTYEQAHKAGEKLADTQTKSITVIDSDGYRS